MMLEWNVFILNFFIIVKILYVFEKLFVFNLEMEIFYRMKFFLKVVIGGRNKYLINGSNVNNIRV